MNGAPNIDVANGCIESEVKAKRNLVLFMPDQLRYDSLGCTGNPVIRTPRFDELAREGTLFTNCFAQASVCTQSRCSMFTSQYLHTSSHRAINDLLKPWEDNMFRILKDDGYHVCAIAPRGDLFAPGGVTEMSMDEHGFIENPPNWPPRGEGTPGSRDTSKATIEERLFFQGLVQETDPNDYDAAAINSSLEWLRSSPPEPFVLFIPLIYPHVPFKVQDPYYSMYQKIELPPRVTLSEKTGYEPKFMAEVRKEHGLDRATEQHWHDVKATYYGMINRLDDQLGSIMDVLRTPTDDGSTLWDRTYTMIFTDHGEYLGDSDLIEKWPSGVHEVLTRDPLMIAGPELPRNQVNDAMCEMVDLMPTVLELLGVEERYPHSGKSLVPTMLGNLQEHKPFAFSEGGFLTREEPQMERGAFPYDKKSAIQHEKPQVVGRAVSVRDKDWAFTYRIYEPAELFNRHDDPGEAHNLAAEPEYAELCQKYRNIIMHWMIETSDYVPWKMDARFPEVNLESTKSQVARRVKAREQATYSNKFNH